MTLLIDQVDTPTAPEDLLREMHLVHLMFEAEVIPGDPAKPFEQREAKWRHIPDHRMIPHWTLRQDGELVAVAEAHMNKHEDLNNAFVSIYVIPDRRRRGLATMLATPVFDRLEAEQRGSVIVDVRDGEPWEPKLEAIGMKRALEDKRSRLLLSDLDWALMDRWIVAAAERATEYFILSLDTPIPEEYLEQWCNVQDVMNTAPKEELEFEDRTWTPERWREYETKNALAGTRIMGSVAVHRPSGEFVGLSNVYLQRFQTDQAWQGDTGVHPEHRNLGLGRWLKAATIKRVMQENPKIERIDTYNAGSNEAMLNINIEMGYRLILLNHAWQGDVAMIRERLGA